MHISQVVMNAVIEKEALYFKVKNTYVCDKRDLS